MSLDLYRKLQNIVRRAFVDRAGVKPSLAHLGDSIAPDVENFQPQGLHFIAPAGAQGALLAPSAITSSAFVVGLGADVPTDSVAAGEGGLHYLGAFKVFLAADGKLSLGSKLPADFVALASLVDDRLQKIQSKFDAHTHDVATTGSSSAQTGTAAAVTSPVGPLAPVASTKVRAE